MAIAGQRYKVTENTSPFASLTGALWWAGGGPLVYLPASGAGSGVGQQLADETGEGVLYITKAAAQDRIALFGVSGSPPWL